MNKNSLENAIRQVHQKYKNKPSPLLFLDPERPVPITPQQGTPKTDASDARSMLTNGFNPQQQPKFF